MSCFKKTWNCKTNKAAKTAQEKERILNSKSLTSDLFAEYKKQLKKAIPPIPHTFGYNLDRINSCGGHTTDLGSWIVSKSTENNLSVNAAAMLVNTCLNHDVNILILNFAKTTKNNLMSKTLHSIEETNHAFLEMMSQKVQPCQFNIAQHMERDIQALFKHLMRSLPDANNHPTYLVIEGLEFMPCLGELLDIMASGCRKNLACILLCSDWSFTQNRQKAEWMEIIAAGCAYRLTLT